MLHYLSIAGNFLLIGYLLWEVIKFVPGYRHLKESVARGESRARTRSYLRALLFEWLMALLAFVGLGFSLANLTVGALGISETPLGLWLSSQRDGIHNGIAGILGGMVIVSLGSIILRSRRRPLTPAPPVAALINWWRKVAPDFSALLPTTGEERKLFAAVAISSGICEEIVFRGWLLFTLHQYLHISGIMLVILGGAIFGLAHSYQGVLGVLATGVAGAFFCMLYLGTGTLVVPIALHILANMRALILPTTEQPAPRSPVLT